MISITAEYALRAVMFLGRAPERAWTTQQVAQATHVPVSYLSKVLQALVRSEVIQSVRGIYGGYQLAGPVTQLTALQIINSVDPIRRIRRCPLGLHEHSVRLCPLHRRVDEAIALTERAFADTTISQLLAEPENRDGCTFPKPGRRARRAGSGNGSSDARAPLKTPRRSTSSAPRTRRTRTKRRR